MDIKNDKKPPIEIADAIEKVSGFYSRSTWLRVLVAAIPYVGGSADILTSAKAQSVFQKRCLYLLDHFSDEVKDLTEAKIDRDFLDSEEWLDLVLQAVDSAIKTRHQKKIRAYAQILSAAIPFQDRNKNSPEDYLSIVSEMSLKDFAFAQAIYLQQKFRSYAGEDSYTWLHRIDACHEVELETSPDGHKNKTTIWTQPSGEWSPDEADFLIMRLQGFGLVQKVTEYPLWLGSGAVIITEPLRKLMEYLSSEVAS